MVIGALWPNQLEPLRGMFPNSIYWQLRLGQGDVMAVQHETGEVQAVIAAERRQRRVELLWLWVAPSLRRQGLGTLLFTRLLTNAVTQGATELQASVPVSSEYQQMRAFLRRIPGDFSSDGSRMMLTTLGAVDLGRIGKRPDRALGISLAQAELWQKRAVVQVLQVQRMPYGMELLQQCYDQQLSRLFFREGALRAMLLTESGEHLCLSYLWCENGWSHVLPVLMHACLHQARKSYPPDIRLYTAAVLPSAQRLGDALLPGAEKIPVLRFRCAIR